MSKIAVQGNATGTGTFTIQAPGTNTDRTLILPDSSGTIVTTESHPAVTAPLTLMTAQASTSGTAIDFVGIPSWVKRVTVMFSGVSTNGTSNPLVQLGAGSVTSSGYVSTCSTYDSAIGTTSYTTGFGMRSSVAANSISCHIVLTNVSGNVWVCSFVLTLGTSVAGGNGAGTVTLSGTLDRIRITTVNGTDTFDAGTINVLYE